MEHFWGYGNMPPSSERLQRSTEEDPLQIIWHLLVLVLFVLSLFYYCF